MPALEPVDQSVQAYEWMTNIATAAALVAGASLASLFDHGLHVDLAKCKMIGGPRVARLAHHLRMFSSVLLSLSFAFEIVVVFVATVTGTMLLSGGQRLVHPFDPFAISATHLLHRELEFEYILIRAGFFQGLLNWLIAIGFRFLVSLMTPPDAVEVDKVDKLNQIPDTPALARKRLFLGVGLMLTMFGLVCFMLAFYNYRASAVLDPFNSGLPCRCRHLALHEPCLHTDADSSWIRTLLRRPKLLRQLRGDAKSAGRACVAALLLLESRDAVDRHRPALLCGPRARVRVCAPRAG